MIKYPTSATTSQATLAAQKVIQIGTRCASTATLTAKISISIVPTTAPRALPVALLLRHQRQPGQQNRREG
jgi:hypothetical protein